MIGRVLYEEPGYGRNDWYSLPEKRREPWRLDADRILEKMAEMATVEDSLTVRTLPANSPEIPERSRLYHFSCSQCGVFENTGKNAAYCPTCETVCYAFAPVEAPCNGEVVKESLSSAPPIPRLPNCGRYMAIDNNGQWHYLNHAGTWQAFQGYPPPLK